MGKPIEEISTGELKTTDDNYDVKAMLKQTELKIIRQDESISALKSQAQIIFGASSIVIPLFGTLQIFSQVPHNLKWLFAAIIALMGILYLLLVYYCLKILDASPYYGPIEMEKEVLAEAFLKKSEREVLLIEFAANLNAIKLNQPGIEKKKKWKKKTNVIFPAIILLALITSALSKLV